MTEPVQHPRPRPEDMHDPAPKPTNPMYNVDDAAIREWARREKEKG
jgi:hypothetical protein